MHQLELIKRELAKAKFEVGYFEQSDANICVTKMLSGFDDWSSKAISERSSILYKIADLYEQNQFTLIKALMVEAKKTLADAISEVRESIDFCRYYAREASHIMQPKKMASITGEENILHLTPKGVFVCISPWNFPLAILTGQIVAALVCGNTVVAKPAEQTPTIANIAVGLMYKAGVSANALTLAMGSGEAVGAALTANSKISGVCFTGGTDTAKHIQKNLLANPAVVTFIAETGGINGMIVDSTALLEQTLDDILQSAFGSAGQRCSALRVLFVQEDIADDLVKLIKGAVQELNFNSGISSDINDVIDENAAKSINCHASVGWHPDWTPAFAGVTSCSVIPAVIELKNISELKAEIFGPVLHIVRFANIEDAIMQINSSGYGLTCGIQTRIESRAEYMAGKIRAGNIYINRSQIGAVVESQPFGGMSLSGTGPKAGGQHYLPRFCNEKVITTNKTAIGGNLDIL